jgi:hypothetical protein
VLHYYFDLVCPYSYILGFKVERVEDDGLAEIEWLPFKFRLAPKELPEYTACRRLLPQSGYSTTAPPCRERSVRC